MASTKKMLTKVKTTASVMSRRASESTEIVKISGMIGALEKKNLELYRKIGEQVYNAHKKAEQADNTELLGQIDAGFAEIEALTKRAALLRGFIICSVCKKECPKADDFCGKCGAALEKKEQDEQQDGKDA